MKTPDKIKKGLEIAVNGCLPCDCPITDCPYDLECHPTSKDTNIDMPKQMAADAIAYIKQLENHIRDLTKKVKQLEVAQPKWINVKDGITKKSGKYIVCTVKGSVYCTSAVISGYPTCSLCGYAEFGMDKSTPYCPNCWAKMDGGKDNRDVDN